MFSRLVRKFVAGDSLQETIENTQPERDAGINIMLNVLGEHYSSQSEVAADVEEYMSTLEKTNANECITISVKPSQLGLDISETLFKQNLLSLAEEFAKNSESILWVDMEDAETTDATLDAVTKVAEKDICQIGVALQANLKRTEEDLARLSGSGVAVRLVKGAYVEDEDISYTDEAVIDSKYKSYISYLFTEFEGYFAIASHDPQMITYTEAYANMNPETMFEIQMLRGVRQSEQYNLASQGYSVSQYTPYGPDWVPYVYRRLREGKNNFWFIFRNVVGI